ncbi:MAG: hypothetical protein WCD68_21775 [Candidatus Acidiferrum sp.]
MAEPYLLHVCVGPQVIDVPMGPGRIAQVMVHSGTNSSGAEGAADIDVEPGLEAHVAMPPDADFGIRS